MEETVADLLQWISDRFNGRRKTEPKVTFSALFRSFQKILQLNNKILELMAEMGDKLGGDYVFDRQYIDSASRRMGSLVYELIYNFNALAPSQRQSLDKIFRKINNDIQEELAGRLVLPQMEYVIAYDMITGDLDDEVGGKNAHIGEIRNRLGLTVPEGFAVTTRAFRTFFSHNGIEDQLSQILQAWRENQLSSEAASRSITAMIASGAMAPSLIHAINKALKQLQRKTGRRQLRLAIRSSAMGEDSEHTFAGQYKSLLNAPQQALLEGYKEVLAGAYSPSAMEYRRQKGIAEHEVVMAVAYQCMIEARVSGVLYTLDPVDPTNEVMVISSTWGIGAPIVNGSAPADRFLVRRHSPHQIQSLDIVRKSQRLVVRPQGGCEFEPVEEKMQTGVSLSKEQIGKLAEVAMLIERYFKCPQDIEWAFDPQGRLFILQARALNIKSGITPVVCDIATAKANFPILFSGKGNIVQNGIASGRVHLVQKNEDLQQFPHGAILVSARTSPRYAKVADKAAGIITDIGSSTGHMAAIAREFRIPTIVNAQIATQILKQGMEITLDAQDNVVYAGRIKELCYFGFLEEAFEESYEYRLLRRVLKKVTPLTLVDPHSKNFTPSACKSLHDITRFIHEKAVEELANLNYHRRSYSDKPGRKLKADIPLDLVIIDIEDGLAAGKDLATVTYDQIRSIPMRTLLDGLLSPGAWNQDPMSVDFKSFMSSLTRTFSTHQTNPQYVGQNLAVISQHYLNINLRLGYHFNMIDAYLSEQVNDNYAYFRFLGGVTDPQRRSRRAQLIYETLARNDFNVDLRGDLVIGRVKKLGLPMMKKKMFLLGQLVGFTRQLDVKMTSDEQIDKFSKEFDRMTIFNGHPEGSGREAS